MFKSLLRRIVKNDLLTCRMEGVGVTQEALEEVGVSPPRLLSRSDRFRTWVDCQIRLPESFLFAKSPGP